MMARLLWDMARESQYVPPAYDDEWDANQGNPYNMGKGRGRGEEVNRGRGNGGPRGRGEGRGDFLRGRGGRGQN